MTAVRVFVLFFLFLWLYVSFWAVVHRCRLRNRAWWFLERCRACIAYEGDPGPWENRK